ncbi:hypothetical protein [Paenibacillus arenosi]|uniref:Uncharacterized protein n=1 Tax=Paenibacillus arenosi TaxID=2774142 RepID=A0ABR9AXX1_9BACL|nr:hypothetical protein [Paenibacillus arenosi]MBD8498867.1 hypothetical protein [Paenibacillus arenosi]
MDITVPCVFCKHLNRAERGKMTCAAFPNGIPKDIHELKFIHTSPYPGDNGVLYERVSESYDYFNYFKGETM